MLSFSILFAVRFSTCSNLLVVISGACVYRAGMTTKFAKLKQELNTALLKDIEKDSVIGLLS
jgi:hypothetical protein